MVNLKNALPKLLLSVAFITVSSTMALADSKSSGSKDKGGCSSNKSGGCGQPKTKICHRTGNGKYILISPANPGVLNGHLGHGDSLAKNGFSPAEILPSTVADPCNFAPTTPPTTAPTGGSKSSGKSSGKSGGKSSGKSGGKSGGKTK